MNQTNHPHLFIAVPLPEDITSMLAAWSTEWRDRLPFRKWVHPADYHITLHFLGGCTPLQAERIKEQIAQTEIHLKPFTLQINQLGFFGQSRKPRILWAGVSGDLHALQHLRETVVSALEPLGFPGENRPYRPHITLAKNYQRDDFPADQLELFHIPETTQNVWQVQEFVLYQTHLGQIPMYEAIRQYALKSVHD